MTAAVTGAPTVRARETRPPAFPAVVHTHTDTLRELQEGPLSAAALAQATDRDPSNMKRDLHKLRNAGVIEPHGALGGAATLKWALTDKGRQWIAGADVAEGLAPAPSRDAAGTDLSTLPVWPLDRIVPNPANRDVDLTTIPDMADSLIHNGQLQPIVLTSVRDDGNRMLLIGERRWRGARLAAEEGRLPPALQAGLRFEEREATEAEAVGIMIVENVERQSIPPLELAFSLARFADLNGADGKPLSGRETAERLGLGQRDVLDKIRIARHATPDAIAAYREHGSWDRLRDSIPASRATPEKGRDPELRYEDPDRPNVAELIRPGDHVRTSYGTGPYRVEEVRRVAGDLGPSWSLILKGYRDGKIDREPSYINGVVADWTEERPRFLKLSKANLDEVFIVEAPATADSDPLVVNGIRFPNAARAHEARRLAGLIPNPSNSGGGKSLKGVLQDLDDGDQDAATTATSPTAVLSARPRLALIEIAHKTAAQRLPIDPVHPAEWTGDPAQDFTAFGCTCGAHWLDAPVQAVIAEGLAHVVQIPGGHPALLALTTAGVDWLVSQNIALPIRMFDLFGAQDDLLPVGGSLYVTDCIGIEAKPTEEGPGDGVGGDPAPVDLWDRDADQIAADDALLLRVMALINPDDHPGHARPGDTAARLMLELGVNPSAEVNDNGGVLLSTEHGPVELITIDARRTLPDARATALAWLVAWAVETAIGGEASVYDEPGPARAPAVPIDQSVTPDHIVCLEDGRRFKSLKRHLRTRYNLSPEQYRARWGLPDDYPMVAENYARAKADLAARMGAAEGAA